MLSEPLEPTSLADPSWMASVWITKETQAQPLLSTNTTTRTDSTDSTEIQHKTQRLSRTVGQHFKIAARAWVSLLISCPILVVFLGMALYATYMKPYWNALEEQGLSSAKEEEDREEKKKQDTIKEEISADEHNYCSQWGYHCEPYHAITQDGYYLRLYRITKETVDPKGRPPVLLVHGLFQCSGVFLSNEKQSLAFTLVEQGYDVWLGNNRAIAGTAHVSLSPKDPEYWQWGLRELGLYDCVAMVECVQQVTQQPKVAYIGHSQGNAQALIALSLQPEWVASLSCVIALAPAVYAGDTSKRSLLIQCMVTMSEKWFSVCFGNGCFLPIMNTSQALFGSSLFSSLAYSMFSYLFTWSDKHWLQRRKVKYFQFTPRPVSVRLMMDWMRGWGRQGMLPYLEPMDTLLPSTRVPLAVFYGTHDALVDGARFVAQFKSPSTAPSLWPILELVHVECTEGYEHMDTIWAENNVTTTYPALLRVLSSATEPAT
ncbi:Alpha/Beta hydrolase protein [Spinellus fusiger]|nr:Alpha/Beta hydrolase protein [Spinellus fusiger]